MLRCMRTTVTIADDLLALVKQRAAVTHRTLSAVIEDAVRAVLMAEDDRTENEPVVLPTAPGAPRSGVDLDDTAALLDLMDERATR